MKMNLVALAFQQAKDEINLLVPVHHGPHKYWWQPDWLVYERFKVSISKGV